MQHIITDEEAIRYNKVFLGTPGSTKESNKEALADFLNNRPQVAQLRPIAEMPETVPEECERHKGYYGELGWTWTFLEDSNATHAIDIHIQLPTPDPDPDAEERRQFEEAMKKACPDFNFTLEQDGKTYRSIRVDAAWIAWSVRDQLAKKGGDK